MQYTITHYIEANSQSEANELSGEMEGFVNHDDTWDSSYSVEITQEEYEEAIE